MATEDDDVGAGQNRLEDMRSEFRDAQQRRLVKRGIALWNQSAASHAAGLNPIGPATADEESE
jgi:hypothetical protein